MDRNLFIVLIFMMALLCCLPGIGRAADNAVPAPEASSDAPYLDVRAYGAKGDGRTDDTTAINAAIADAVSGRRSRKILFPNGTYITGGINNNSQNAWSITIEGQSVTGSQIKLKDNANRDVVAINKERVPSYWPTYWVFRNILIDGNSANNTSGDCIYLYHANEFKFDSVVVQNCAGYAYNIQDSLGIKIDGFTILGNTANPAKGLGGINIHDSSEIIINGTAVQGFHQPVWPLTITKTAAHTDPVNITLNSFYLEDNLNGIKLNLDGSGAGANIVFNQPRLIGLGARGGTAFDVTADTWCRVTMNGGAVYGNWDADWMKLSANAGNVSFHEVHGISNFVSNQEDYAGYIATMQQPETYNYIPNGNFEFWDTMLTSNPVRGQGLRVNLSPGGTQEKDTTNYRSGRAAYKIDNSKASAWSTIAYTFTQQELNQVLGKWLNSAVWIKGSAANAGDTYIHIVAASLRGGFADWVSARNHGTSWERVRTIGYIPQDTSAIVVYARAFNPATVTFDLWSCTANYVGPFTAKEQGDLLGSINWNPGGLSAGSGVTSPAITVPGTNFSDTVVVNAPYDMRGCQATAYVQSANNVVIRMQNGTEGTAAFDSGLWSVRVRKGTGY